MKILLTTPQNNHHLWVELNEQKGYLDLIQEVQRAKIPVKTNELIIASVEKISSRLIPYLLGLEPLKACWINYFLCQGKDREERTSFLIETYSDWGLNDTPIYQICLGYEREKTKKFWSKYRFGYLQKVLVKKLNFKISHFNQKS